MIQLKIKGLRDLIETKDHSIKDDWISFKKGEKSNDLVVLEKWIGNFSEIASVKTVEGNKSESEFVKNNDVEYRDNLFNMRALSSEDRAKCLGFFKLIYWGFTEQKSEEVKLKDGTPILELAEKLQKVFYDNNPKRTIPNPSIFKSIIKSINCHSPVMRVVENFVNQDRFAEKYI